MNISVRTAKLKNKTMQLKAAKSFQEELYTEMTVNNEEES